ncbi:MAG TPA: hypothetical protein VGK73_18505 [Polyangiaceae bacterium]
MRARRDAHGAELRGGRDLGLFRAVLGFRAVACSSIALLALARATPVLAEERPESPLSAYRVPAGCPTAGVFSEQVGARTPLWRRAEGLSVVVDVRAAPEGTIGHVSLERDGRATEREITASSCDEAVQALALIVAILIDPLAATGPVFAVPAPPATPVEPVSPVSPRAERRWFVLAGTELAFEGGIAPGLSPGIRVSAAAFRRSPASIVSSLRLSAFRFASGTVPAAGGASAAFELTGGRLEACSFGFASWPLRVVPCLFGELGALAASGTHPERSHSETVFWAAAGPAVRASAELANVLYVELEAGAVLPLVAYDFGFEGEPVPAHETPVIAGEFSAGLGVRFP